MLEINNYFEAQGGEEDISGCNDLLMNQEARCKKKEAIFVIVLAQNYSEFKCNDSSALNCAVLVKLEVCLKEIYFGVNKKFHVPYRRNSF